MKFFLAVLQKLYICKTYVLPLSYISSQNTKFSVANTYEKMPNLTKWPEKCK